MKVAVVGATGFIGSAVVEQLEERELEVIGISRSRRQYKGAIKGNVSSHLGLDIGKAEEGVYDYIGRPELLIHLAWEGLSDYKSLHHIEVELPRQYYFLKRLIQEGLKHLTVVGTCFEYGKQYGSLHEGLPTVPCTSYGLAKDTLRKALELLKNEYAFSLTWLRLFYVYGEGQARSSLYSQLKKAAESGLEVFNMSGGDQLRDFLPVERAAHYIAEIALMKGDFGVVNVCSGEPVSVRSVVERWIREKGWNIRLNLGYYPYNEYEPMAFWGSTRKLQRILKEGVQWEPKSDRG